MPIPYAQISSAPNVNSNQFVDIPGLTFDLPPASSAQQVALITLNVPTPFAEGTDFPGLDFAININGQIAASGTFTYSIRRPESFGRQPFNLVVRVGLLNGQHSHVRAQWRSVRGSTGHIDSFASISAILG